MHDVPLPLTEWSNFYVITGSSAAALTGLMFVVITLIADRRTHLGSEGLAIFSTPNVAHFCAALLVSVVLSAPWHSLVPPGVLIGLTGLYGVVYTLLIMRRAQRLTKYRPEFEDWLWYVLLPFVAYATIVVTALRLAAAPAGALFALAGATLLLVFIGIHNAWDVVTFITIDDPSDPDDEATT